jgi:hypothetical protein
MTGLQFGEDLDPLEGNPDSPQQAPDLKIPPKYRLQKYTVAGAGEPVANAGVYLQLWNQKEVDRWNQEMLLLLNARQISDRAHVAVILHRRREPGQKLIAKLS